MTTLTTVRNTCFVVCVLLLGALLGLLLRDAWPAIPIRDLIRVTAGFLAAFAAILGGLSWAVDSVLIRATRLWHVIAWTAFCVTGAGALLICSGSW